MRFMQRTIKFSPKEAECLVQQYDRLRRYTYHNLENLDNIREKLSTTRTITILEWKQYMKWRRPKGTPFATPCYMKILDLYFKKRRCIYCKGTGHDNVGNVCECGGSGVNSKVKELLGV